MTTEPRFERQLPTILDDLYLGPTPDYRHEVLAAATRTRQRPAWTFPGRWIPMADIASAPTIAPRLPWRSIGVALVIVALLAAAAFAFVGSRQTKLPPAFGVARNGLIAYASGGDIYIADPATGVIRAAVTGPEEERSPIFSRDGTRLAFTRSVSGRLGYDLAVARSDGTEARVVTTTPIGRTDPFEWAPDGASLIVYSEPKILRIDAVGSAPPVVINANVSATGRLGPLGQILFQPGEIADDALWVMDIDGSNPKELIRKTAATSGSGDLSRARFSPDGKMIAFQQFPPNDTGQLRIYVMNADGSNLRPLDSEPGIWFEDDATWSPDGKHIAFNRWKQDQASGEATVYAIGVASIDGGPVIDAGPVPASEGALFDWSPDGSTIVSLPAPFQDPVIGLQGKPITIDPLTGTWRELSFPVGSFTSWQRLAR